MHVMVRDRLTNYLNTTAKGVVVDIIDDVKMPLDPVSGIRADIIMDPTSIPSRMNVSRLYEQYFNGTSRRIKQIITEQINAYVGNDMSNNEKIDMLTQEQILELFQHIINVLGILATPQYDRYLQLVNNNNLFEMKNILLEILDEEFFIYYTVSATKKAYQVVEEIRQTIYAPNIGKVMYDKDGVVVEGKSDVMIAPLYIILLFKTADEYLSTASARTNHYNFPISASKNTKHTLPWRNSPTKICSETEVRIYAIYASRLAIAELKDRANNIETHKEVYRNILEAETPTNVDCLVDRKKIPYGKDSSIQLVESVFHCAGIDLEYIDE